MSWRENCNEKTPVRSYLLRAYQQGMYEVVKRTYCRFSVLVILFRPENYYNCKWNLAIAELSIRFGTNLTLFINVSGADAPVLFVNDSNLSRCMNG